MKHYLEVLIQLANVMRKGGEQQLITLLLWVISWHESGVSENPVRDLRTPDQMVIERLTSMC